MKPFGNHRSETDLQTCLELSFATHVQGNSIAFLLCMQQHEVGQCVAMYHRCFLSSIGPFALNVLHTLQDWDQKSCHLLGAQLFVAISLDMLVTVTENQNALAFWPNLAYICQNYWHCTAVALAACSRYAFGFPKPEEDFTVQRKEPASRPNAKLHGNLKLDAAGQSYANLNCAAAAWLGSRKDWHVIWQLAITDCIVTVA